MSNANDAM